MDFAATWLAGYIHPSRMMEDLRALPAPHWGFTAQLLRGLLDSLLLYLPLYLAGHVPPTPSYLHFLATEEYYGVLVLLAPLVLMAQWLLGGALIHLVLRLAGRESDMDLILNITGMTSLVVGAFLLVWDWLWIALGGVNQYTLGITHLAIDIWGVVLVVIGLRRLLDVPVWLAVVVAAATVAVGMPLAIMFMRSPI